MSKRGLDVDAIVEAARMFEGAHDFKCYVVRRGESFSTITTLDEVQVEDLGEFLAVKFVGRGFRNKMLRKISWALRAVGQGIWSLEDVRESLRDCKSVVPSAPPEGLLLLRVSYREEPNYVLWGYAIRSMVRYFAEVYYKCEVLAQVAKRLIYELFAFLDPRLPP